VVCTFGFLVSFFIGPESAAILCGFLYKKCISYIAFFAIILCCFGLIKMYISKEQAFTLGSGGSG